MVITFKDFKSINKQINQVADYLKRIGSCSSIVAYMCGKFGIDRGSYSFLLDTGDITDVAEFVALYLDPATRESVLLDLAQVSALN